MSTPYTSLPLELTCRKIITDNYHRVLGYRLENKQNTNEIRDIKPDALETAIYNKQVVVVDNIELLKNWGLVKKDKSTDNKQFILEPHIAMLKTELFENYIYSKANIKFKSNQDIDKVVKKSQLLGFKVETLGNLVAIIKGKDVEVLSDKEFAFKERSTALFYDLSCNSLDLSNINTDYIKQANNMFCSCEINELNLSNWNNKVLKNTTNMFYNSKVANIKFDNWNTNSITNMTGMFEGMVIYNKLDISNFKFNKNTKLDNMFAFSKIGILDISNFKDEIIANNQSQAESQKEKIYKSMFKEANIDVLICKDTKVKENILKYKGSITRIGNIQTI